MKITDSFLENMLLRFPLRTINIIHASLDCLYKVSSYFIFPVSPVLILHVQLPSFLPLLFIHTIQSDHSQSSSSTKLYITMSSNPEDQVAGGAGEAAEPALDFLPVSTPSFPYGLDPNDASADELIAYQQELEAMRARAEAVEEENDPSFEGDAEGGNRDLHWDWTRGTGYESEAPPVEIFERQRRPYRMQK
jgi:hypothetical protein